MCFLMTFLEAISLLPPLLLLIYLPSVSWLKLDCKIFWIANASFLCVDAVGHNLHWSPCSIQGLIFHLLSRAPLCSTDKQQTKESKTGQSTHNVLFLIAARFSSPKASFKMQWVFCSRVDAVGRLWTTITSPNKLWKLGRVLLYTA